MMYRLGNKSKGSTILGGAMERLARPTNLSTLSGKRLLRSVGTHLITAKRADSAAEIDSCHVLFFRSSAGRKRTEAAISGLTSTSILLGREDENFLGQGGMINLVLKNGTVRFEVDRTILSRANIHFSSELLALALGNPEHGPADGSEGHRRPSLAR